MAQTISFIHASDLHLGAPFRGLRALSPAWADRLVEAIPQAFDRLIQAALDEAVDFVILAGDIFDNAQPSYANFTHFVEGIKRLEAANIPVYFCTGNHDPYVSWQHDFATLPANIHLFSPEHADFKVFERDGQPLAVLAGRSYYNQAWPEGQDVSEGISRAACDAACAAKAGSVAPFALGVIHTGLNIDPTRSPADPQELIARGMDYWACGHIHQHLVFPEQHPVVVFSGCPQGRDIKEQGDRGVLKVTLTEGQDASITFIPTASVVWRQLEVDVSSCSTVAEIGELITNEQFSSNANSHCKNMVCRVSITGATRLHRELTDEVLADLRDGLNRRYPFFFIDTLTNVTRPVQDRAKLEAEGLFPSVYLQTADEHRVNTEDSLAYLDQQFSARHLALPTDVVNAVDDLYQQAETMVLDLLTQEDDHGR